MTRFISPFKAKLYDNILKSIIIFLSLCVLIPLFFILFFIIQRGIMHLSPLFFTSDSPFPVADDVYAVMSTIEKSTALGGIRNAFVGMLMIVGMSALWAIPVGIMTAVFLSENPRSVISKTALICADALQGIPSIIYGITANIWVVLTFKNYSAISGSIALGMMMLPIVIKSSYETLQLVPRTLKEGALALGVPYSKVIFKIVLPAAAGGIASGSLLGISRIIGETAPLLFTAFGNPYFSTNIFQPVETIAIQIYKNATAPNVNLNENAWGAALALVLVTLVLNLVVKPAIDRIKIKF
ncbi:MAG: phosphate ABC transporter permease PstA [Brevinema sp.]